MNQVIPTLFATDKQTFFEKLEKLKFSPFLHIDFMDGKFTNDKSMSLEEIDAIKNLENRFEIHLMSYDSDKFLNKIKNIKSIYKVLLQYESFKDKKHLVNTINLYKKENFNVFLVLNPSTEIEEINEFQSLVDGVMFMSVWPGKEGQEFIEDILRKIKILSTLSPRLIIQVDGGIKLHNSKEIVKSGAKILAIGSEISSNANPKKIYENILKNIN